MDMQNYTEEISTCYAPTTLPLFKPFSTNSETLRCLTSLFVTRLRLRKNSSFLRPTVRRSTTSSPSTVMRPSLLSNTTFK